MSKTILITGATGNISSGAIEHLLKKGAKLRALVRSKEKGAALAQKGIEVFEGDLSRPRTLQPAFKGAETVWILTPPGPRAPEQSSNALWAARQGGARHVVRMSAIGAAHDAPTLNSRMHALSDGELAASGIPFTILKPHFFMQNLMMSAATVAAQGMMYLAFGEGRLPMIDSRDIGEAAAEVLTTPGHEGKTYTLTGPRAISLPDVAEALGKALGKPVKYVPVPIDAADEAMAKMGMDEWMRTMMTDYFAAYSRGWSAAVTEDLPTILGRAGRSIDDFARDFKGAFAKTS